MFVHVLPALKRASRSLGEGFVIPRSRGGCVPPPSPVGVPLLLRARARREGVDAPTDGRAKTTSLFWVHLGSFVVDNGLIGYLLFHPETPDVGNSLLSSVATAFHLLVNDVGLHDHLDEAYHRTGRW